MEDKLISRKQRFYYALSGCAIFIGIWAVLGHILLSRPEFEYLSGFHPLNTFKAFCGLVIDPEFWGSVLVSLKRIFIGLIWAIILGVPAGMAIGFYDRIWRITYVPVQFLRMISPLAWMPIAIIIFPRFESAIYFLITISCIWPILINTAQGVNRVNEEFLQMARNQGANDRQLLSKIIFPSSLPYIVIGFRLALGLAWVVLVPAEFLGISSGLGYSINDARDTLEYDRLLALVVTIGCIGLCLDSTVQMIEKRCYLRYMIRTEE